MNCSVCGGTPRVLYRNRASTKPDWRCEGCLDKPLEPAVKKLSEMIAKGLSLRTPGST